MASPELAEDARVLHDTVINTLGAIANGGAAVRDLEELQARCHHDVQALARLIGGADVPDRSWAEEIPSGTVDQQVRHTGLVGSQVDAVLADLPPSAARALRRASAELVRNSLKHSSAPEVRVDVRSGGGQVSVTVRDEGRGFDGRPVPGRGLADSVLARAGAAGLEVEISSAPARGTTVRLSYRPAVDTAAAAEADAPSRGVRARRRWRDAGLHTSVDLLRAIADGTLLPRDHTVQRLAADEESHLRELIKLDPSLTSLGYWLARALQHARGRQVRLVLRTGGKDLPEADAAEVGALLLRAIDLLPPRETLVATLFEVAPGLRVSLVARAPYLSSLAPVSERHLCRQLLGEQEMVEMTVERTEQGAFTS